MSNLRATKGVKHQTRRVKQEAIDDSSSLLRDISSAEFSYPAAPLNPEAAPVPSLPIASAVPPADAHQPVKKEIDPEEQQLLKDHWAFCRTLLLDIWNAIPAVPSSKSRCEWAKAHDVPPTNVHSWFYSRKRARKKEGMETHPDDGYELQVEQPGEPLPTSSSGELGLGFRNTPLASSSLAPSSPPHTPLMGFGVPEPWIAAWSPILPSVASQPTLKVQTPPPRPTPLPRTPPGYKEVWPCEAAENVLVPPAPKAKCGRKRKANVDGGAAPALESVKVTTESIPKSKRPKVETKSAVNAPSTEPTGNSSISKDTGEGSPPRDPKALTSRTVPPHSFAAQTYTSMLLAPFAPENAYKNASHPPNVPSSNSLAPVNELLVTKPSPYITQPLPPLPAFEALEDPVAFFKGCKDTLRKSLEINFGMGLWDPVVEALPASYFLDLGKDIDFEWPEIEWP